MNPPCPPPWSPVLFVVDPNLRSTDAARSAPDACGDAPAEVAGGDVDGAEARLLQAQSQLSTATDDIRVEVERARQRAIETQHVVRLYVDRMLPAARAQIESAQIGYETGRNSFQALIDAERSLRTLEIRYQEAIAALGQRHAELKRATGRMPGLREEGGKR